MQSKVSITSRYTQQGYDVERSPLWHQASVRRGGRMLSLRVVLKLREWQSNIGNIKLTSQDRTKRIRCQCSSNNCQRIIFSNFTCYTVSHDMEERLPKKNWPWVYIQWKLKEEQKYTHHDLDHHAPIRSMKIRTAKRVNQLGKDGRDEKHGHAHRTQVGKNAGSGEDNHAVCRIKW